MVPEQSAGRHTSAILIVFQHDSRRHPTYSARARPGGEGHTAQSTIQTSGRVLGPPQADGKAADTVGCSEAPFS
jgi:hypothetical protein